MKPLKGRRNPKGLLPRKAHLKPVCRGGTLHSSHHGRPADGDTQSRQEDQWGHEQGGGQLGQ